MRTTWSGALVEWSDCTRLIDGLEVWTKKGECDDLDTEYNSVERKGSLKRVRRRRGGARDVGPRESVSDR